VWSLMKIFQALTASTMKSLTYFLREMQLSTYWQDAAMLLSEFINHINGLIRMGVFQELHGINCNKQDIFEGFCLLSRIMGSIPILQHL